MFYVVVEVGGVLFGYVYVGLYCVWFVYCYMVEDFIYFDIVV